MPNEGKSIGRRVRGLVVDGSLLAGGGLLSYGSWLVYPPAGFLMGGALLFGLGVVGVISGLRR